MPHSNRLCTLLVAALLVGGAGSLALPSIVHASTTDDAPGAQTWAVVPADEAGPDGRSTLDYVVEPNTDFTDHIAVRNLGEQPLTVTVYAQDAVQTAESEFDVLTPDEPGSSISSWITLNTAEVTVPPRSNSVVPFELRIPGDAEPGDHAGAILGVSAAPEGEEGAAVQYRVGTRVNIRVGGPIEAAVEVDTIDARYDHGWALFSPSPLDVTATIENTGNVRVTPETEITVSGLFGWWERSTAVDGIDLLLPDGAQAAATRMEGVPPIGPLWITVDVPSTRSAGQDITELTQVDSRTIVVWAVPWLLLAVAGLLVVAGIVAIVNLRRRRRARNYREEDAA